MWQYNYELAPYSSELYHYGVKGMKWGRRKKYYNKDGSLNTAGKQKEAKDKYKSARKAATNSAERKAAKKQYKQDIENTYNKNYHSLNRAYDKTQLGRKGMNRINDKMNSGQSYARASNTEYAKRFAKQVALSAAILAAPYVAKATVRSLDKYVTDRAMQKANEGLLRIGTMHYKKVAGNVYTSYMK